MRGHRRVTYQAVRTFNLSSGLGVTGSFKPSGLFPPALQK
ncbi:hypothetical protein ECDEC1B_0289 [Escherichia coli DEC1B]|nr:hypothetical protein ECDEC1B_0289 [Escherichia coli DEC1B]